MSEQDYTFRARPYLWLIRLIGVIVPRRFRTDWRQEWKLIASNARSAWIISARSAWISGRRSPALSGALANISRMSRLVSTMPPLLKPSMPNSIRSSSTVLRYSGSFFFYRPPY